MLLFVAAALMLLLARDRLHVYETWLREKSPHIATNFAALSVNMDEAAVRKHFEGLSLTCISQAPGNDSLGDRACYAQVDKADGDGALTLAAFFRNGKLERTFVQTPWWVHGSWVDRLTAQYGEPSKAGRIAFFGGPVLHWTMPNGYIETNRDRSINLLTWNVIVWTGEKITDVVK